MKVILLAKVPKLGSLGDQVVVKRGYARNYLLPQGFAVMATAANSAEFEARRAELEKQAAEKVEAAKLRAEKLEGLELTITQAASDEGKLYGSVGAFELVEALAEAGHEASKQEILLPLGPIRVIGEHKIEMHLSHSDVTVTLNVNVESA